MLRIGMIRGEGNPNGFVKSATTGNTSICPNSARICAADLDARDPDCTPREVDSVVARGDEDGVLDLAVGEVGVESTCGIYDHRPVPCRVFTASWANGERNESCDRARQQIGLPPLPRP